MVSKHSNYLAMTCWVKNRVYPVGWAPAQLSPWLVRCPRHLDHPNDLFRDFFWRTGVKPVKALAMFGDVHHNTDLWLSPVLLFVYPWYLVDSGWYHVDINIVEACKIPTVKKSEATMANFVRPTTSLWIIISFVSENKKTLGCHPLFQTNPNIRIGYIQYPMILPLNMRQKFLWYRHLFHDHTIQPCLIDGWIINHGCIMDNKWYRLS